MGPKWGIKSFLSTIRDDFSATSQRPIFAKFGHHACITVVTQILDINLRKLSIQGSFALKTPNVKEVKQAPHSEQATGQEMHCREILFTPHCSSRARESPRSGQRFCTTYGCGAAGRHICPFSDFGLFSPYRTPKMYPTVTGIQPRGYIAE